MNILLDEHEIEVREALTEFFREECTSKVVREALASSLGYSENLWRKFAELGWIGLCLPENCGGQGLPLTHLCLALEEAGYRIAPLPFYATMVAAAVLARHGGEHHRTMLSKVATGDLVLSFAHSEKSGRWFQPELGMTGRIAGNRVILEGSKYFVEFFELSGKCLVTVMLDGQEPAAILVDCVAEGISIERLVTMGGDEVTIATFDKVEVPIENLLGAPGSYGAVVADIENFGALLLVPLMQGAARRALHLGVEYINQREAFGRPIGSFQSMQHLAADMLNAVDGAQLLSREAFWLESRGIAASVEISQAKAFANDKCLMVCRSAQQMFGGLGFIAETDINLWYRRTAAWSMRGGTTREHRDRVARALLDSEGVVRLGVRLEDPAPASRAGTGR